jgi:hypothetical protein
VRWAWVALACACAPRVAVPEEAGHEGDVPVEVPYPPPAARPEKLPAQPHDEAVWLDGYWRWSGDEYRWAAGRWVTPPSGMGYAPASILRRRNGDLLYYQPGWRRLQNNN